MKNQVLSLIIALLLTTSCSKEDTSAWDNEDYSTIKLTTRTDEGYTLSQYEGTTLSLSLFYATDDIDNVTNTKWSYASQSGWTTPSSPLWKNNCDGVTIMAYAPYVDEVDNLDQIPFTVSDDQSEGVASSDFMTYKKEGYIPDNDGYTVDITFEHQLSTLTIYLTYGDEFNGSPDVESVELNALTSTVYNFTNNELAQATTSASIKAYESVENTQYSVVFPPQTIESGQEMINIKIGGVDYTFESATQYVLAQGTAYYITLRVGQDVAPVGSVVVGSWADGGSILGGEAIADKSGISLNGEVYEITTATGLRSFANLVNTGSTSINGELMCDIDLESVEWTPIGDDSNKYSGEFDGAGHKVKGLYINSSATSVGLFGSAEGAEIKNLGVEGSVTGSNDLSASIGGVVGFASECSIIACYNRAGIEGSGSSANVGGIVGCAFVGSEIIACYNTGSVSGTGVVNIGGIVGSVVVSTITSCYFTQGADNGYGTLVSSISDLNSYIETMNSSITTGYKYVNMGDSISPELEEAE